MGIKKMYLISVKEVIKERIPRYSSGYYDWGMDRGYEWERIHSDREKEIWEGEKKIDKKPVIADNKNEALELYNEYYGYDYDEGKNEYSNTTAWVVKIIPLNSKTALTRKDILEKRKKKFKKKYKKAKEKCRDAKMYKRRLYHINKELKEC